MNKIRITIEFGTGGTSDDGIDSFEVELKDRVELTALKEDTLFKYGLSPNFYKIIIKKIKELMAIRGEQLKRKRTVI